jgi:DNA-binding phage protein
MIDEQIEDALKQLEAWIKEHERTEAFLARKLGVSRSRLNALLKRKGRPNMGTWEKIQAFLRKEKKR